MRDLIRHILREELILETSKKRNTEDFINKAKEVHGDKYDYTPTNYVNSRTKVEINCPKHGIFEIRANDHIQGRGCKKCGIENQTKPFETVMKQFKDAHGDFYDYSQVDYKQTDSKVKIICPIHGEFQQTPINHLKGQGCPKCGFEKGQFTNRDRANKFKKEFIDNA